MRNGVLLALLIALASSGAAQAIDQTAGVDASAILTQQRQIRDEAMARQGRYKNMEEAKRSDLFVQQSVVFQLLDGKQNSNELAEPDRVKLFNALEAIEASINNARDEQVVCEFIRSVGSNRPQRVCKTYAQRAKEREAAEKELSRQIGCTTGACR
jgi:hypothetical protein